MSLIASPTGEDAAAAPPPPPAAASAAAPPLRDVPPSNAGCDGIRVGICTTLRLPALANGGAASALDSFLRWHLQHLDFAHVFLFFDDPEHDPSLAVAEAWPSTRVTAVKRDGALRARQAEECTLWSELGEFYEDEVQARQSLNAELAVGMARARGVTWLLHIDIDELFFTSAPSIAPHFQRLESSGVSQMTYTNHEAIPERSTIGDYFRGATLFRRHHFEVPMALKARDAMQWWERRTNHGQYMLCYDNGKSAARVVDGLVPRNVHTWRLPRVDSSVPTTVAADASAADDDTTLQTPPMVSCTALADPRSLDLSRVLTLPRGEPCILHFVVCGIEWFCAKYRFLGNIPSSWFGGALPIPPCFHLDSRDAYLASVAATDSDSGCGGSAEDPMSAARAAVRPFFEAQVLFAPTNVPQHAALRRAHIDAGVLLEIDLVQSALRKLREAARLPGAELPLPPAAALAPDAIDNDAEAAAGKTGAAAAPPPAPTAEPAAPSAAAAAAPAPAAFGYDRSWILSSVARQFLGDQLFQGGSGAAPAKPEP